MSKAKQKGTGVETALVRYAGTFGMSAARRLALAGANDVGDVELIPAIGDRGSVIAECKYTSGTVHTRAWMRELETEVANAGAETGLLVVKHPGAGDHSVWRWLAMFTPDGFDSVCDHSDRGWVRMCPFGSVNQYVSSFIGSRSGCEGEVLSAMRRIDVRGTVVVAMPLAAAMKILVDAYPVLHP